MDSNGEALSKKPITRSLKSSDLADGLEEGGSSSKCWWNNFLKEEDQLDDIKFGNKMVLLMEILKESALIGDKVNAAPAPFTFISLSSCRFWCSVSPCCLWT